MPARLLPGRDEKAPAGGVRAAGLEADDLVPAQQRVVVANHPGHRNDRRGLSRDRGQRGHPHRRQAEAHLIGRGADGGRVEAGRVGVAGAGHAQTAGGTVHPGNERSLVPAIPPCEYPGHVVGRGQQQRLQRLALGDYLPGGDGYQRVAGPSLRRVGGCLRRPDLDIRPRSSRGQGMVAQDHVRGHHLGDAGDRHRPGRARSGYHAEAADVGGRDPVGWPRDRAQALRPRRGRPGGRRRLGAWCQRPGGSCLELRHGETGETGETGQAGEHGHQNQDAPHAAQSRQRAVASPYAVFGTPAICTGS